MEGSMATVGGLLRLELLFKVVPQPQQLDVMSVTDVDVDSLLNVFEITSNETIRQM